MMEDQDFAQTLLNDALDGALETRRPLIPTGLYEATIIEIAEPRKVEWDRDGEHHERYVIDFVFELEKGLGRIYHGVFVKLNSKGRISAEDNKELGRLLSAVGCNAPGKRISDATGKYCIVTVEHKERNDEMREVIKKVMAPKS